MNETIYSCFQNIVQKRKNDTAIVENGRTLTFGEFSDLVDTIAGGFPTETKSVGIVMDHRAELIATILAVLKCGAAYVPAEPTFPTGRIHDMMNEAKVDFIVTERKYTKQLEDFPLHLANSEAYDFGISSKARTVEQNPFAAAYILYTSGTTGRPKGICVTNRNVCHYVRAFFHEFHPSFEDVMLQYSVCTFDIFVEEVFASLLNGTALAIPSEEDKANIYTLMKFVERHHVTIITSFPYLLAEMNHLPTIPSSLRLLISGGDVLRKSYVTKLLEQTEVYNTYGPSETTVCASYYRCNNGMVLDDGTYPIGTPVKGSDIRILDQDGKELRDGLTGEICIYGDGVSLGYIRKEDHKEESKVFVTSSDGSLMYHSGDYGYRLPDGNFAFLHRKDTQIMIYGKRVEITEVESRLYQCSNIQQALVHAFTDEDGLAYMIAYVVPKDGILKISAIKKELSQYLPSFMIPEYIVKMPRITLNANGKPDISSLPVVMKEGLYR